MKQNWNVYFWALNILTTILRLLFVNTIGLTVDESHYWVYSKFLSLSYFDHPPLAGYLIKVSTLIFGDSVFAVRFPAVLIFFIASFIFYLCAKKLFDSKIAFIAIVFLNIIPVFSFFGAILTIPDSPLALFYLMSFYFFILIIRDGDRKIYWHLLGLSMGLSMLSKYNGIMAPIGVFLFLFLSKKHRFYFKSKEPYLALLECFIIFLPVIIWNWQNNWVSFTFQLNHGFGSADLPIVSPLLFLQNIAAQSGYISPPFFILLAASAYFCIKEFYLENDIPIKERNFLILSFSLPILFLFNAVSLFNEILPHWPAVGYLPLTIYAAFIAKQFWNKKWFRRYIYISYIFTALVLIVAVLHIKYKIIPIEKFLPSQKVSQIKYDVPESERIDITNEVFGWKEIGDEIIKIYSSFPNDKKPFIFTYKSYLAGQLYFGISKFRVYCLSDRMDGYDFWQKNLDALKGKSGIYIVSDYFYEDPQVYYGEAFSSYSNPQEFAIYRNGKKIRNFFIFLCENFDPDKLKDKIKTPNT